MRKYLIIIILLLVLILVMFIKYNKQNQTTTCEEKFMNETGARIDTARDYCNQMEDK